MAVLTVSLLSFIKVLGWLEKKEEEEEDEQWTTIIYGSNYFKVASQK